MLEPKPVQSRSEATFFALVQSEDPQVRCAVDIGGTLAKVAFFEDLDSAATDAPALRSLHARTAAFLTIKGGLQTRERLESESVLARRVVLLSPRFPVSLVFGNSVAETPFEVHLL